MPSIDDVYAGATIKAPDLQNRSWELTITGVHSRDFDDGTKLVIEFRGTNKVLICNKTNANLIAESHGREYNTWPGKRIRIYPDRTPFKGVMTDCVRVELPEHRTAPQAPLAPAPQRQVPRTVPQEPMAGAHEPPPAEAPDFTRELNDEIPF